GLGHSAPSLPNRVDNPAHNSIARIALTVAHQREAAKFDHRLTQCYGHRMNVAPLPRSRLAEAELVLADACAFDRATEVADEKLFGPGPTSAPQPFGAWQGNDLVGVAAVSARWLRVLAVVPRARKHGVGSALLAACEAAAKTEGMTRLTAL